VALASTLLAQEELPAGTILRDRLVTHTFVVVRGELLVSPGVGSSIVVGRGDVVGLLHGAMSAARSGEARALTMVRALVADENSSAQLLSLPGIARALVRGAAGRGRAALAQRQVVDLSDADAIGSC
jgi:CRP-like cAMP-binding protein